MPAGSVAIAAAPAMRCDRRQQRYAYVTFQMAEVAVPRQNLVQTLSLIARLRAGSACALSECDQVRRSVSDGDRSEAVQYYFCRSP
jgi:hypothetical protein